MKIGERRIRIYKENGVLWKQKKRDREAQQMRDSLAVGDEVTTIGGIIGKVVSIKEETFVLETTKDRTKIRFLKGAIRSIDVKMADIAASVLETKAAEATAQEAPAEVEAREENTEENK
jgi:preprotein translocase subunit YajC